MAVLHPRFLLAHFLLGVFLSPTVWAVEVGKNSQTSQAEKVEKLQVTGSRIKRADLEGSSPILILDRKYLDRTGYNSLGDVLRDSTVGGLGGGRESSLNGGVGQGASTASIRTMGSGRILVLLDGQRLPTMGGSTEVDMNLIPMAAIERVEILKDGASALYGSDALGGVINFITKRDYEGVSLNLGYFHPEEPGGNRGNITASFGKSGSNYNFLGVVNYRRNQPLWSRHRDFGVPQKEYFSIMGSPGSWVEVGASGDKTSYPYNAGGGEDSCSPGRARPTRTGGEVCSFDYSPYSQLMPQIDQYSTLLKGSLRLSQDIEIFSSFIYTYRSVNSQLAPPPDSFSKPSEGSEDFRISRETGERWGLPVRWRDKVNVYYRLVEEAGPRIGENRTHSYGFTQGVRGELGGTWEWELTAKQSQSLLNSRGVSGYANKNTLFEMANATPPTFNPFKASGDKDDVSSAFYVPVADISSFMGGLQLQATGELFDLPHGALSMAVGTLANWQTYKESGDPVTVGGHQWGGGSSSEGQGRRNFQSGYMELYFPALRELEVQLAGRFDRYSDFGSTFNPKVGLRYSLTSWISFRASGGTGFMAPSLESLYGGKSEGFPFGQDPFNKNGPNQFRTVSSGNPDLKEETSQSWNFGTIIQPSRSIFFSLDYYVNNLKNVVSSPTLRDIFDAEKKGLDMESLGIEVDRGGVPRGLVQQITAPILNFSVINTQGLDFRFAYDTPILSKWNLSLVWDYARILQYEVEALPGLGLEDRLGFAGTPPWRNNVNLTLHGGDYSFGTVVRTIARQRWSRVAPKGFGWTRDHTEIDLYGQYTSSWGQFSLGVRNIFATPRPFQREYQGSGYVNTTLYDPMGRTVFATYSQQF